MIAANTDGPGFPQEKAKNRRSVVILARYTRGGFVEDFWFTGDATEETEKAIVNHYAYRNGTGGEPLDRPNTVYLKVGHHGSHESSSSRFLKWLRPTDAVVSGKPSSRHGHPRCNVLERIDSSGLSRGNNPAGPRGCGRPATVVSGAKRRKVTATVVDSVDSRVVTTSSQQPGEDIFIYLGAAL